MLFISSNNLLINNNDNINSKVNNKEIIIENRSNLKLAENSNNNILNESEQIQRQRNSINHIENDKINLNFSKLELKNELRKVVRLNSNKLDSEKPINEKKNDIQSTDYYFEHLYQNYLCCRNYNSNVFRKASIILSFDNYIKKSYYDSLEDELSNLNIRIN